MNKASAVDLLSRFINEKLEHELRVSRSFSEDLYEAKTYRLGRDCLQYYFLEEYSNGFYLGEIRNGKRNGYGFYYWFPDNRNDNLRGVLHMGYWRDGDERGEGFHLESNGICSHGDFVDGKLHCSHAHVVGDGVDYEGAFENGVLKNVLYSNSSFNFKGSDGVQLSYDSKTGRLTSEADRRRGCVTLLVVAAVIYLLLRMC